MAAYMIVFCKIKDRARFVEDYARPTAALVVQFGGEYLLRTPRVTQLEGDFGDGMASVISRWPNRAALDAFYNSPAYQPLKAARAAVSDCHILIAEDQA